MTLAQLNSPRSEVPLEIYLSLEVPGHIQKVLLWLAVDIYENPVIEDKLKSLCRYATFAYKLSKELEIGNGLGQMSVFVIRDVSHTLIHLMNLSYQKGEFELAVVACHFYRQFCSTCFPTFASVIESFLMVIVNTLVPLAKSEGDLGLQSQLLLKFLIVEKSEHLSSAIAMLDPFPHDAVFAQINEVYMQIKRSKNADSLEETIKHFLNVGSKNLGYRAEGLKHLRTQLSEKKQELSMIYNDLNDMRGFSEDCSRSLLHQLIIMLVELTSVTDSKISLEASRCLGELGPADLTTMVLKPDNSQQLQDDHFTYNPMLMFTAHVLQLLVEYLVDENIKVVDAAGTALYKVLASNEGQQVCFAEQIIPYLVTLILNEDDAVCTTVLNKCICYFFKKHFEQRCQINKEQTLRNSKDGVCFNRASVQCMLNIVQFVRLQKCLEASER
ncbi:hypothetical protein C0J52_20491 [Blattella germanica]|nr:hypothetical protein C0J52_20491 [Blattella germanica]